MAESGATVTARLAAIVGPGHVLTAPADVEPHLVDWRGRYHGRALAVVRPGTREEVAAVVRVCAEAGTSIVPQGGNTSMCGGATPDTRGDAVVLLLTRLASVRAVDVANATMTVEAGVTLAAAQAAAAAAGLRLPLSLASEGSCTIGGNLSTNAGGTAVLRFGNARAFVLGLEVVLADGRRWDGLSGLRKDNTGYDVKQWFIGAEGTLGIITAAVLKLYPRPSAAATAMVRVASVERAVALLAALQQALGDRLEGFELIAALALALAVRHTPGAVDPLPGAPWVVLVEACDNGTDAELAERVNAALATAIEGGIADDAVVAQTLAQRQALWALRENISEAQRREGPNIKHDISLPVSAVPAFIAEAHAALTAVFPGVRFVTFGHLGDGNLHYNLSAPAGADGRAFMDEAARANRIVHDLVHAHGGSVSAEHGIGQLKRGELARYKTATELDLMQKLKSALDPANLMNPGKVLP
ncbi:MAG: FAD-binding oxidoreductase [Proteobacteria bacterium]|nr:FAD-binding oxidoreductase [Pseudomonadota bacterium]